MARKQPISGKTNAAIKPERARKLIRRFHVLLKSQASAQANGDIKEAKAIEEEINRIGGLKTYQRASICGQSKVRGGDSSKVLMEWLPQEYTGSLLEVGCLSVDNVCARSKRFEPHIRIDLNSQHPLIQQQDFMTLRYTQPFEIISLSLVVNYVPNAQTRGKMLIRAHKFLSEAGYLFFVLPRACTDNSRYCNDSILHEVFESIGFEVRNERKTTKLVYWLLVKHNHGTGKRVPKRKVRDSASMNNFAIVI